MHHHVGILVHRRLPIGQRLVGLLPFFAQAFVGLLALWIPPSLNAVRVQLLSFQCRGASPTGYASFQRQRRMNTLSQFAGGSIL
jgi:hypothetical protein